jgi:hypothetical protein
MRTRCVKFWQKVIYAEHIKCPDGRYAIFCHSPKNPKEEQNYKVAEFYHNYKVA